MRRPLLGRAVGLGLVASAGLGALVAMPANADCVEVHAEARYEDRPTWYPLGGPHRCVAPTPWEHMVETSVERHFYDPPEQFPSYVWFHVWIPVP